MRSTFGLLEWPRRTSARGSRAVAVAVAFLVLAGCGGQSSAPATSQPASAAPTAAPTTSVTLSAELCSAATEYQVAANALVDLNATQVGIDGVKQALQDLQTAGGDLAAAAKEQFAPQVAELESAVASLRGTIAGLTDQDSLSTNLGKIATSVGGVEQAAQPIVDSGRAGCPSVPSAEAPPTA
jgi:hypothetical protein